MFSAPDLTPIFNVLRHLSEGLDKFGYEFEKEQAEYMLERIKYHIDRQDLKWEPLQQSYVAYKNQRGLEVGTWIATRDLYEKLSVVEVDGHFYIGAEEDVMHEPSGLTINHIIQVHEFGVLKLGIPARPLFAPSKRETLKKMPRHFIVFTGNYLKKLMKQEDELD